MKGKNLVIGLSGRKIKLNVVNTGFFGKFWGLMFTRREKADILLFENAKKVGIHSFFVFFPFLCLWLDDKNNVVEWKIVKTFSVYEKSKYQFTKIVEIPVSRRYHSLVTFIVGERFKKRR